MTSDVPEIRINSDAIHRAMIENQMKEVKECVGQMKQVIDETREDVVSIKTMMAVQDASWRKQTCPWRDVLADQEHALANGGRRFGSIDGDVEDHEKRLKILEELVLTRETQKSLWEKIFAWAWKLGIIALVLERILRYFDGIPFN